eukprot:757281-Ditylum_brightwellii.AAC.1
MQTSCVVNLGRSWGTHFAIRTTTFEEYSEALCNFVATFSHWGGSAKAIKAVGHGQYSSSSLP